MISTGVSSSLALKNADASIPHVFLSQDDPVRRGFVQSLNRPGGHATGVSLLTAVLAGKRVEFARQIMPADAPLAYLANLPAVEAARYLQEIKAVAHEIKQELVVVNASSPAEIDAAFTDLVGKRAGALIVSTDGYLFSRREQIIALAWRHKVPAIYDRRDYAMTGGLVSYGPDLADAYRQIGIYAARILKGEKPGDLPVVQPTKFELVQPQGCDGVARKLRLASASLACSLRGALSRARTPVAITVQPLKSCRRQESPVRLGQLRIWKRRLSIQAHPNQLSAPPKIVWDSALGGACR
jgi:ABC-type uncharacterized transport system substrate-binding protein